MTHEDFERAVGELLREEAERRRPDRRGPRGNPAARDEAVERGRAELERVLGW